MVILDAYRTYWWIVASCCTRFYENFSDIRASFPWVANGNFTCFNNHSSLLRFIVYAMPSCLWNPTRSYERSSALLSMAQGWPEEISTWLLRVSLQLDISWLRQLWICQGLHVAISEQEALWRSEGWHDELLHWKSFLLLYIDVVESFMRADIHIYRCMLTLVIINART